MFADAQVTASAEAMVALTLMDHYLRNRGQNAGMQRSPLDNTKKERGGAEERREGRE